MIKLAYVIALALVACDQPTPAQIEAKASTQYTICKARCPSNAYVITLFDVGGKYGDYSPCGCMYLPEKP